MEQLIPNLTFTILGISAFFTLLLPLIVTFFMVAMKKLPLKPILIGAACFFISQMVLRIPLIQLVASAVGKDAYVAFAESVLGLLLIGGLSAGFFEESARLICGKFILKENNGFKEAVAFGLGHAFCECILLVGMTQVSMIMTGFTINDGRYLTALQEDMAKNPGYYPIDYFQQVLDQYASVSFMTAACSVLERAGAIAFHVFATVIIFKGIREKKLWLWPVAIVLHCILNFVTVMISQNFGVIAGTAAIVVMGALFLAGIIFIKPKTVKREMI